MMNKKSLDLKKDKRAVSPVIGVILMVAITVILAAVIAAFVFGYGAPTEVPQASLKLVTADESESLVVFEHQGGDGVVFADTRAIITPDIGTPGTTVDGGALEMASGSAEMGSPDVFEPGERAINSDTTTLTAGETCKVVIIHTISGKQISTGTITIVE